MGLIDWLQSRSWNPANKINLSSRYRDVPASEQVRCAQSPPVLLRMQGDWQQAQFYRELGQRLQTLNPDEVGLELLLDARLEAARGSTLGGQEAEMRAMREVVASLHATENTNAPKEGWKTRKRAREYVARRLGLLAEAAARRGETEAALEAFRAIEDTGAMTPSHLRVYGNLLRTRKEGSDQDSLRVYLQCLEAYGWKVAGDPLLEELGKTLSDHLHIDEQVPRQEVQKRLLLIARVLAGGGNLNGYAKSVGMGLLFLDQPHRAVSHLERACETDGHDGGESFFYLAQSLYRTEQFKRASTAFEEAAQRGYAQSRIAAWQGLSLAKSGEWKAAYELFRLAEQTLGQEADAAFFVYWARACYHMGVSDEAKTRFRQAIGLESQTKELGLAFDRIRARHGLAICISQEGDVNQAIELLQESMRIQKFAPASHLLGRLFEKQDKPAEALPHYRTAAELSPADMVYKLSLGLALDAAGQPEALPLLTEVMESGKGCPEVMRRLALGYRRKGDHDSARNWFSQLARADPANEDFSRWVARYAASQATDSFNRGAFGEAAGHWERVSPVWSHSTVSERLGLALLCDASLRLKSEWNRGLDSVWPQIQRAHQLAPCWESRYLNALASLVHGDYQASHAEFVALDDGAQERPAVRFLAALTRYLNGEEDAVNDLNGLENLPDLPSLNVLVGLLQIQNAAQSGDFQLAVQRIEQWIGLPDCLEAAQPNRAQVNALVWICLRQLLRQKGIKQRTGIQRLVAKLQGVNPDFWAPAHAVVHAALELHNKKPGEADVAQLEKCQRLFQTGLECLAESDSGLLRAEFAEFIRFRIEDGLLRGDLVTAISLLERLSVITKTEDPAAVRLKALLDQRMNLPTHEKAYALMESDPEQARDIWLKRLDLDSGEHASLEHLACLAWTRAYDAGQRADRTRALAGQSKDANEGKRLETDIAHDYEAVVAYFAEGLSYFRRLYADENYWEALRTKGRLLSNPDNTFKEDDFDAWRASALQKKAQDLVSFARHVTDHDKKNGQAGAKSAMARLRDCGLPKDMVEALADTFAQAYLGNDATSILPEHFEPTMASAERVLQADPKNIGALEFIISGHTYRAESSRNEDPGVVADRIASVRKSAERLEKLMTETSESRKLRDIRHLAGYFETLGTTANLKANALVTELNAARGFPHQLVRNLRKALEGSNQAFDHAIRLDSTIALRTARAQEFNNRLLGQLGDHGKD